MQIFALYIVFHIITLFMIALYMIVHVLYIIVMYRMKCN